MNLFTLPLLLATLPGLAVPADQPRSEPAAGSVMIRNSGLAEDSDPALEARRQRIQARLDGAALEAHQALDAQLDSLAELFEQAAQNAPAFADQVLGFWSLWTLANERLPWSTPGQSIAELEQTFTTTLLDPETLEAAVCHAASGYLNTLTEIESRVLIDLRADLADGPGGPPPAGLDPDVLPAAIAPLVAEAGRRANAELRAVLARELAVLATSPVLTKAALRLTTVTGLGGVALRSGPVPLAIGLAAALVMDEVLAQAWTWYADPRGALIQEVRGCLANLQAVLLEGHPDAPGLRPQLTEETQRRWAALQAALLPMAAIPPSDPRDRP